MKYSAFSFSNSTHCVNVYMLQNNFDCVYCIRSCGSQFPLADIETVQLNVANVCRI